MMQELHRLEAAFSGYMRNEADNNKNYRSRACRLLEKLMNDQLRDYDTLLTNNTYTIDGDILLGGSFNNVRILDFNYTDPIYGIKPHLPSSTSTGTYMAGTSFSALTATASTPMTPIIQVS